MARISASRCIQRRNRCSAKTIGDGGASAVGQSNNGRKIADRYMLLFTILIFSTLMAQEDVESSYYHDLDLSKRRANVVVATLTTDHGIDASRLKADGLVQIAPVRAT